MQTAPPIRYEVFKAANDICEAATCKERQRLDASTGEFDFDLEVQFVPWSKYIDKFIDTATRTQELHTDATLQEQSSPFDELDEKLPSGEKVKKLLKYLPETTEIPFSHKISDRLIHLIELLDEEPDEESISFESLRNFISFLRNTKNLKYPDIVLTPLNEICAQWRTAVNRHFSVIFQPTGNNVQYVIFKPRPKHPDEIDRVSGTTSVDALMETVEPHNVCKWACK